MYYVYILLSLKDKKFYIGFTSNLKRRINDHISGRNLSTKPRRPFKLIYYEAHLSKEDAQRRDKYFKTTKGKSTLKQIKEKPSNHQGELFHGANWTNVVAVDDRVPTYGTVGTGEAYGPRSIRTIVIISPNPFLHVVKKRVYI